MTEIEPGDYSTDDKLTLAHVAEVIRVLTDDPNNFDAYYKAAQQLNEHDRILACAEAKIINRERAERRALATKEAGL